MRVKTHLIVTDQWDEYGVKWYGKIADSNPLFKNNLPIFVIITKQGRVELNTLNLKEVEKVAKRMAFPRGRGSITTDKAYIYIKEENGGEKIMGVVERCHVRKYAPMFDEV